MVSEDEKECIFHSLYDMLDVILKQVAKSVLQSRGKKWSVVLINAKHSRQVLPQGNPILFLPSKIKEKQ